MDSKSWMVAYRYVSANLHLLFGFVWCLWPDSSARSALVCCSAATLMFSYTDAQCPKLSVFVFYVF